MAITYLCPVVNHSAGGIKVLYRHSEMLSAHGIDSCIFQPDNPAYSCTWFKHNAKLREAKPFNIQNDFVVVPEVWAASMGKQCLERNIKYAIFVQNAFLIRAGKNQNATELKKIYQEADLIMSISEHTTEMISLAYPNIQENKIIRLLPNMGGNFTSGKKKKIISFMPRKLPDHAEMVYFLLKEHLPEDWSLVPVVNKSEDEVANLLSESSIFLSFSDLEGFGLPPLEAAFCGNMVVGYTGQGGKEYFDPPVFHEVQNGDFVKYIEGVMEAIKKVDAGMLASPVFTEQVERLKTKYSKENELAHLLSFASRASEILAEK